jgi:methionyl-tRNA formyltransferase
MSAARPRRIVFFGSGAFGVPTLEALIAAPAAWEIALVVSQPDRPAGRGRALTPTPIAAIAEARGLPCRKPADVNTPDEIAAIRSLGSFGALGAGGVDAFVVIAFGQKLSPELLGDTFAINLHASLLPAYRGAAPINWALIDGCDETGISVIGLAQRMDAGLVYATRRTQIGRTETCGELHDRLATLGVPAVVETLERFGRGDLGGVPQDERLVSKARKLRREDGRIDVASASARMLRGRIHGLTPWPGCDCCVDGEVVRLLRVRDEAMEGGDAMPGRVLPDGSIGCASGRLVVLELQAPGGRPMSLEAYRAGRPWRVGAAVTPVASPL